MLTPRFVDAVSLAMEVHGDARRMGTEIPYMAHLLVVTGLVIDGGESWVQRKARYLEHLESVRDDGTLRVSLADKVHNARSIVRDYRASGSTLWERFTEKTAGDQISYYGELLEFFSRRCPGPLTEDLWRAVGELSWLVSHDEDAPTEDVQAARKLAAEIERRQGQGGHGALEDPPGER